MRSLWNNIISYLQKWLMAQYWEIILLVAIVILAVFFTTKCFAGMDFTGLGGHDQAMIVPHFFSLQQAVNFAVDVRWNEEVLQELKKRRAINWEYAYHPTKGWMLRGQKQEGNMYRDQWLWNDLAVSIIERYKERGQKGAEFYAISEPVFSRLNNR